MAVTDERFVTLRDFQDGGLTAGPRDVHVYLPPGYTGSTETYRVLYFNDGEGVFGGIEKSRGVRADADYALDRLLAEQLVHPAILVAVANAKGVNNGRGTDLVPRLTPESKGGAEQYYSFITTRLKPYVDSHFRTKPEARYTGIVGYSLGGLAAFYFGYYHPETFGLAGCMAPSLWMADSKLLGDVGSDGRAKHQTRFWLDGGEKDAADIERIAPRMAALLVKKGWTEGDDVAFQLGYGHTHSGTALRERMRDALYFLLRKEAPAVKGFSLRPLADPSATTMNLETAGDRAYVWPEVRYDHGFYLNSVAIPLRIDNPAVAHIEVARIHAVAPGSATVTAEFNGIKAKLPITGYTRGAYRKLPVTAKTPEVDGDVSDWVALPHEIGTAARFGVSFDDRFVYVGVTVKDSRLVIQPGKPSSDQDGVDIWLDARADPMRAESKAQADGYQTTFAYARISPSLSSVVPPSRPPLPKDSKTACRLTQDGYSAEIAIPVEYLNRMQGSDWREFRLNVHVSDFTSASEPKSDLWWQPAWRSLQVTAGSGTFERR